MSTMHGAPHGIKIDWGSLSCLPYPPLFLTENTLSTVYNAPSGLLVRSSHWLNAHIIDKRVASVWHTEAESQHHVGASSCQWPLKG